MPRSARVRQRGPITGGLFLEDEIAELGSGEEFIPDHDQWLVAGGGCDVDARALGATLSVTMRYETGTPIERDEDDDDELQIAPGAETADFDRGRVEAQNGRIPAWPRCHSGRVAARSALVRASV